MSKLLHNYVKLSFKEKNRKTLDFKYFFCYNNQRIKHIRRAKLGSAYKIGPKSDELCGSKNKEEELKWQQLQ